METIAFWHRDLYRRRSPKPSKIWKLVKVSECCFRYEFFNLLWIFPIKGKIRNILWKLYINQLFNIRFTTSYPWVKKAPTIKLVFPLMFPDELSFNLQPKGCILTQGWNILKRMLKNIFRILTIFLEHSIPLLKKLISLNATRGEESSISHD